MAVGESTTDFKVVGVQNKVVAEWISENLVYDQCILEFYDPREGLYSGWIHVSYSSTSARQQDLTINKNGTFLGFI